MNGLRKRSGTKRVNLVGQTFGHVTVLEYRGSRANHHKWLVRCACGQVWETWGDTVRVLDSCGRATCPYHGSRTHGHSSVKRSREYHSWDAMKQRCLNPKTSNYHLYGGRAPNPVTIFPAWIASFTAFFAYLGPRPAKHTLDRIDNAGHYEPGNVRWAPTKVQARNTRRNIRVTWRGQTRTLAEWTESLGFTDWTLLNRRNRGWSVERMLTQPETKKCVRKAA